MIGPFEIKKKQYFVKCNKGDKSVTIMESVGENASYLVASFPLANPMKALLIDKVEESLKLEVVYSEKYEPYSGDKFNWEPA